MRRLLATALPVLLLLSACGGGGNSADADPDNPISLEITVTKSMLLPWLVAKDESLFEPHGVKIDKINLGDGGSSTLRSALAGGSPVAEASFSAVVEAIEQGAELQIVSGALRTSLGVDFYALANNDAIDSIEDAKRLGVTSPGSVSEVVTSLALDRLKLASKPELVHTGGVGEGIALLEAGDIDATFIPLPVPTEVQGKIKPVLHASDELGAFQALVIVVTKDYAEGHPKAVEAIIAGYQDFIDRIADDPQEAAEVYAAEIDVPVAQARALVDQTVESKVWSVGFDTEALKRAVQGMTFTGHSGKVDFCSILTDAYLPDGAPSGPLEDC